MRVLEAGKHSLELCGGTHVKALGDIGPIKVVSEGSIGSNLRRIEAITGTATIERLRHDEHVLGEAAAMLGVKPDQVVEGVTRRLDEVKALRDEIKALRQQQAGGDASELATEAVDGIVIARRDGTSRDELRELALAVRQQPGIRAVVLMGAPEGGGAALVSAVAGGSGLHPSELIADAAKTVKGGAGKSADVAVAGGKDPSKLDEALQQVPRRPGWREGAGARSGVEAHRCRRVRSERDDRVPRPSPRAHRVARRDHKAIGELVAEWGAELVVVGLPLSLSGDDGPAARATREEVAELALALAVPVELHDERLTTVTASRTLQEAKMTADARRRIVDKVAAAVLLQSWLDERASRRRREAPGPE